MAWTAKHGGLDVNLLALLLPLARMGKVKYPEDQGQLIGVKMESFKWGPHFITGLRSVDDQHRELVVRINQFGTLLAENTMRYEDILHLLEDLSAYAARHFQDEETLMAEQEVDIRLREQQISEHHSFLVDVIAMRDQLTPDTLDRAGSLLKFLIHWLAYHILGTDQKIVPQIRAREGGRPHDQAVPMEQEQRGNSTEPLLAALSGLFELVSKRNQELLELNQSLETKVVERTRELKMANEHLEAIALTDVLTRLPNRRHALHRLEELWGETRQEGCPLACIMIDADGFKTINDNYGHDAGDVVLQRLARELQYSVRSDDLVCRLGGDEFLIICPKTPLTGALHIAELTRERVADLRVPAGEGIWYGSISVGVAVSSPELTSIDALLKVADNGVYRAKRDGKNCVRAG